MAIKQGYSLIELTIVVGLVALLGVGISSVVLMSLVTTKRTRNLTHVREVGDYATTQIKQLVRNSKRIEACDSANNTLTLRNQDGDTTLISTEIVGDYERIASGSGNYITPSDIKVESFSITCLPDDTNPELVKVRFDSQIASETLKPRENPLINFETSISIRNN